MATEPEKQDETKIENPFDYNEFHEQFEEESDPAPEPEEKPADATKPEEKPTPIVEAPKPSIPSALRNAALRHGATRQEIEASTLDELNAFVEEEDAKQHRTKPAAQPAAELSEEDKILEALEKEVGVDPKLASLLKGQAQQLKELKAALQVDRQQREVNEKQAAARQHQARVKTIDNIFEGLSAEMYGKGTVLDLQKVPDSVELARRNATFAAAAIQSGDSAETIKAKLERAHTILFVAKPKEEKSKLTARRVTQEEWNGGGLQTPTSGEKKLGKSAEAAVKAATAKLREMRSKQSDEE